MLAIDGGGSKTDIVLFREDGHIIFKEKGQGTNPLDIGVDSSKQILLDLMRTAVSKAPKRLSAIYAGVAGLVYFDRYFEDSDIDSLSCDYFKIETDGRNLISSELNNEEDGCCLIVGTGCGTWVRNRKYKDIFHVGGWGYLVDTLGSGYSLGREAVRAVCLAQDGRGKKTILTDLLREKTHKDLFKCIPELYAGGRAKFASLAHLVFDGKSLNDQVCADIIQDGAKRLSELIWAVDRYFDYAYPVITGGGIVTSYPEYFELIQSKCPPKATLLLASAPPVFGAAVEAMHRSNLQITSDFRNTFMNDLKKDTKSSLP